MIRIACLLLLGLLCACDRGTPAGSSAASPQAAAAADARAVAAVPDAPAATTPAPAAAMPGPEPEPGLVLPGDFAQSTSLADLQERFGPHNVLVDEAAQDDGTTRRGVVLFPDDPARRAYVDFYDEATLEGVASIVVRDAGSVWRGKAGVRVGMTFAELRAANDWPFNFSGFWDDGTAYVRDQWSPAVGDESRLGRLDVGEGEHMYFGVDLGLKEPAADIPPGDYPHEDNISSDDPGYPRLGEIAVVTAIVASTSLDDEWE